MDLRKLKTLIDLVSESNVSELEITEAEGRVRIVKGNSAMVQQYAAPSAMPASAATPVQAAGVVAPGPVRCQPLSAIPSSRRWSALFIARRPRVPKLLLKSGIRSEQARLCASSRR